MNWYWVILACFPTVSFIPKQKNGDYNNPHFMINNQGVFLNLKRIALRKIGGVGQFFFNAE